MPLTPRIILWITFAIAILVAAALAVITLAGNTKPDAQRWMFFSSGLLGMLVLQAGYLLAPFVLGRDGWLLWLTVSLMAPSLLAILLAIAPSIYLAITATRPDGATGWRTIAGIGPPALIALVAYGLPPVMLIVHRGR